MLKSQNYLWLFPFISFLMGYSTITWFWHIPTIETPLLIGKSLHQAVLLLSPHNLNIKIIGQKEDNDLPEGTIISQSPQVHHKIKQHQTVFCTISHQSPKGVAPILTGLALEKLDEIVKKEHIRPKYYHLETAYPKDYCIAQIPSNGLLLKDSIMTIYLATKSQKQVLMPSFKGKLARESKDFLQPYGIIPLVFHKTMVDRDHTCASCTIIDQKPLAGTLIDLNKPIKVQFQVK